MYEYWFLGLTDDQGNFDHTGTTYDFLEMVANIGRVFGPSTAGKFVAELIETNADELAFLRITDWKCEFSFFSFDGVSQTIKLQYTPR